MGHDPLNSVFRIFYPQGFGSPSTQTAPLSVDLAPPRLVGRYLAASSISWQIGWIVGPAVGGFFLQHRPLLLWPVAAAVNLACAGAALALERRLPEGVRKTPTAETQVLPVAANG